MTNYVLFKEFGTYCITDEENYNTTYRDENKVIKFFKSFTSKYEVLFKLHNLGFKQEIIDKTGE